MKQSSVIFGALLVAFLVYVTIRNQLPEYLALFSSNSNSTGSVANTPNTNEVFGKSSKIIPDHLRAQLDKQLSSMFANIGLG